MASLAGCGAQPDAILPPAPTAEPEVVRFAAIGDPGRDTPTQRAVAGAVARVCAARGCDFGLMLGDLLYERGMVSPDDPRLGAALEPFLQAAPAWYLVHGNHDYGHVFDRERAAWARAWAQRTPGVHHPAPAYRFEAGPAELWALDTTAAFWLGAEPQRGWLEAGLASSDRRWRVGFGHHPLRSNGRHGNAGAYEGWVNLPWASGRAVAELLEPLCGGADLYLSGHDHNLQLQHHCGVALVVSGSAASTTELVGRGNEARFERAVPGFAWIELGRTGRVLFFDESGTLLHESDAIEPSGVLYSPIGPTGGHP